MHTAILSKLKQIEKDHSVKILYAVESGSRGWGFASKDSDYDVRFIYIHHTDWYLSIENKKDFIEYPINDLLDINGWDIRKALMLFRKSNPPLLEWLSSPIVYIEKFSTAQSMRDLTGTYFSPVPTLYHYLHMAKGKFTEAMTKDPVKIKKYFYILRPVFACMWIEKNKTMPPMEFSKLLSGRQLDTVLYDINKLMGKKVAGQEFDLEPQSPVIIDFLKEKINYYDRYLKTVKKDKTPDYDLLNSLFRNTLKEVWG